MGEKDNISRSVNDCTDNSFNHVDPNLFDQFQELTDSGYWNYHIDHGKLCFSYHATKILGMGNTPKEINPAEIFKHLERKDFNRIRKIIQEHSSDKGKFKFETRFSLHGKKTKWIEITAIIQKNKGVITSGYGFMKDITIKKLGEFSISENEAKYRKLLDASEDLIFEFDEELRFTYFNNQLQSHLGYTLQELIGQHLTTIILEKDQELAFSTIKKVTLKKGKIKEIIHLLHKDGRVIAYEIHGITFSDQQKVERIMTIARNIDSKTREAYNLKESEERYKLLADSTQEAIFISESGYCIETNEKACEMFGYKYEELIGSWGTEILAPESRKQVDKKMRSGYREPYEAIALKKDGTRFPVMFFTAKETEYKGKKIRLTICRDISKEKKLQNEVIQQKQNLEKAEIVASFGNWEFHLEKGIAIISRGARLIYGLKEETEVYSINDLQNIPLRKYRIPLDNQLKNLIKKGQSYDTEFEIKRPCDNRIAYIKSIATYDQERDVVFGVIQEITKQKQNELQLQQTQQELIIKNNISNSFLKHTEKHFISSVLTILQQAFDSYYGALGFINKESKLEIPVIHRDLYDTEIEKTLILKKSQWSDIWGDALKTGMIFRNNELIKFPNGTKSIGYAIAAPIIKENATFGCLLLARDKHAYTDEEENFLFRLSSYIAPLLDTRLQEDHRKKELMAAKNKAEESDKLKSAFLANMSHEIRTPMNGIIGFSEMMLDPGIPGEQKQEFTSIIVESSRQLMNVVDDILEIAKLESGNIGYNESSFDLNQLLADIQIKYDRKVVEKGLRYITENTIDDAHASIRTDKEKLLQILENLIDNAIKFTKNGDIKVSYQLRGSLLEFSIKDSGIGIPADLHNAIFEHFRQADLNLTRRYGGTGLGLAISKSLVNFLGGEIWLTSVPDHGSTFYFTIPFNPLSAMPQKKDRIKKRTILIVEDDEISKRYFSKILEDKNIHIIFAANGEEAIRMVSHNPSISLVFTEIRLPVLDGISATKKIKTLRSDIHVIMVTASTRDEDMRNAYEAGCSNYFSKPISRANLDTIINKYLK